MTANFAWKQAARVGLSGCLGVLLVVACASPVPRQDKAANSATRLASSVSVPAGTRGFYMGFTPFHYSWIEDKLPETYKMIEAHSDIILHHFDEGVPWPEALRNAPYHEEVEAKLEFRKKQKKKGQKVFVATTPIDFNRKQLAMYWGEKEGMERPKEWRELKFDDPKVIEAYINYCKRLIETFKPDYFSYGIEVNLLARNSPQDYEKFKVLASRVYPEIKRMYPELPVMLSFYLLPPNQIETTRKQVNPLLPYTDIFAISTYPYMGLDGAGYAASEIPPDWFTQVRKVAPDKPFAIAETGYIAEDFSAFTTKIPGSPEQQVIYVDRLMREAAALDAEFVIWFVVADYDDLWTVLKFVVMFSPLARAWKDTGLFDGDLQPRPALDVWDRWLKLPYRPAP